MSDPLSLLREYIINKQPVSHDEQSIIIGELRFPRSTVTAYKQDRGRGDPYPLEALYFLVQKPHLAGAAKTRPYNDECRKASFSKVLLADQKDVLAYLTGKTETSQYLVSIDELAVLAVPAAPSDAPSGTLPPRSPPPQRTAPAASPPDPAPRHLSMSTRRVPLGVTPPPPNGSAPGRRRPRGREAAPGGALPGPDQRGHQGREAGVGRGHGRARARAH